jgi:hypothetical protein
MRSRTITTRGQLQHSPHLAMGGTVGAPAGDTKMKTSAEHRGTKSGAIKGIFTPENRKEQTMRVL